MRILFLVHVLGRMRHFKNVISGLVDRGHTVILAPVSTTDSDRTRKGLYVTRGSSWPNARHAAAIAGLR